MKGMEPNFTDLPLDASQSAHIIDASRVQDLGAKQIKILQKIFFKLEEEHKERQAQVKSLELEMQETQQQLSALISTQSAYENAAAVIMKEFNIEPPYQASFVYDKGKPIAIRVLNKSQT